MTTVVDELVVTLGMDTSKFTQGQRDALDSLRRMQYQLEEGGKSAESQGKKLDEFFGGLKRNALALGAAFFGGRGVKEFTEYITHLDASVGRASVTLRMNADELSAWQGVARQTGGSAEGVTGSMQGLTDQVSKFVLTGQGGAFVGVFNALGISMKDSNGALKTAGQLYMDLNHAVQGMDPSKARVLLQSLGADPATINLLLMSETALRAMLGQMRQINLTSKESAQSAQELQAAWTGAELAAEGLGRKILNFLSPALAGYLKQAREGFISATNGKPTADSWGTTIGRWFGLIAPAGGAASTDEAGFAAAYSGAGKATGSAAEHEAYIRKAASARGIDPDVAVRVARSEGLGGKYAGDDGSSFGDFQLHMGGLSSRPGMGGSGLGDTFRKRTGLDARDPSTWQAQVDFSLDQAKAGGWGPWHGWQGLPFAGIPSVGPGAMAGGSGGRGGDSRTTTVQIGTMVVNTPDAGAFAKDVKGALERESFAAGANNGLN